MSMWWGIVGSVRLSWGWGWVGAVLCHLQGSLTVHIEITSVRLTHRYTTGVKLIHIEITSVRLSHIHYGCEAHSH